MPSARRTMAVTTLAAALGAALTIAPFGGTRDASGATSGSARVTRITLPGLENPVEILRDRWGISHIYAQSEQDLFFAQGWNAARDRLFQLELWRRQATGTVAELLGPREIRRDHGTRLFRFRGDLQRELQHYHPRGQLIIESFVRGINAYIDEANSRPDSLPIEFRMLGTRPQHWTPEVVISRHQGLLGNIGAELNTGRAVAAIGADMVKRFNVYGPGDPDLRLDPGIDSALLAADILRLYNAYRGSLRFQPQDIVPSMRRAARGSDAPGDLDTVWSARASLPAHEHGLEIGSNNWVVSGRLTESRYPIMANDPHRALQAPSLRYWVHLNAPGWNVIGGGEPSLPGISIGHNEHGAWGLTIFSTDGEDLYVYETNPANRNEYRYRGRWEAMRVLQDTIAVKGQAPEVVELRYTRHGPVVFADSARNRAFAVRAAWMEIGGAPYLASLRMNQARDWEEFRAACEYSHIPGENMVWADTSGTIGWQVVGIAPIRPDWSGLVPVPGDGRYEWEGYLPGRQLPHVVNPPEGYFATANNELVPRDYPHMRAIGYAWSDPYRWARVSEILASGRRHSMTDMMRLQTDELSVPARQLVPLLRTLTAQDARVERARRMLLGWDHVLDRESAAAGVYVEWEAQLRRMMWERTVPPTARGYIRGLALSRVIEWVVAPPGELGTSPLAVRDTLLLDALAAAVRQLSGRFGPDPSGWVYGRPGYKHALIRHPLSGAVSNDVRGRLEVGPAPRGGYANTPNATGSADNQTSGASFRIIVDLGDWDAAVGTNTPGQSGDPRSAHYRDLFADWAADRFFPVTYSRERVEAATSERLVLEPRTAP